MKSDNSNTESMKKRSIKHRQLSLEEREKLAKHAIKYGVNNTATLFGKHFTTVKRWCDRYLNGEVFTNIETTPLTSTEHKYLLSIINLVGQKSLRQIKNEHSLPYSIDTLAKYYRKQNIIIEQKYLLILKCQNCLKWIRAINIYFGRPRIIKCPYCDYFKLDRLEYLKIPFCNPRPQDYFFNRSLLTPINSDYYKEAVLPLLKIPKDLKCLLVYNIRPRKHNRIHIVKYFEKIGDNTIPVAYCGVGFSNLNKRELFSPRSREVDTGLICQNCQVPYFRDFQKYGDKFPNIKVKSSDQLQITLKLFSLAQKYNNTIAYTLMDISKKRYYSLKKQYPEYFEAIRYLKNGIL